MSRALQGREFLFLLGGALGWGCWVGGKYTVTRNSPFSRGPYRFTFLPEIHDCLRGPVSSSTLTSSQFNPLHGTRRSVHVCTHEVRGYLFPPKHLPMRADTVTREEGLLLLSGAGTPANPVRTGRHTHTPTNHTSVSICALHTPAPRSLPTGCGRHSLVPKPASAGTGLGTETQLLHPPAYPDGQTSRPFMQRSVFTATHTCSPRTQTGVRTRIKTQPGSGGGRHPFGGLRGGAEVFHLFADKVTPPLGVCRPRVRSPLSLSVCTLTTRRRHPVVEPSGDFEAQRRDNIP